MNDGAVIYIIKNLVTNKTIKFKIKEAKSN